MFVKKENAERVVETRGVIACSSALTITSMVLRAQFKAAPLLTLLLSRAFTPRSLFCAASAAPSWAEPATMIDSIDCCSLRSSSLPRNVFLKPDWTVPSWKLKLSPIAKREKCPLRSPRSWSRTGQTNRLQTPHCSGALPADLHP